MPPPPRDPRRPAPRRATGRRPSGRYRRPVTPARRVLLAVLAAGAYLAAAAATVVVLVDLARWGVLGSAAMGLLVALLVVVGRGALSAMRGEAALEEPAQGGPPPGR